MNIIENGYFIPKKIKAGFNYSGLERKLLAFLIPDFIKYSKSIYLSWKKWRSKNIDVLLFDNVPTSGFCLGENTDFVYHNVNQTTKICVRLIDPRGFEFEIKTDNFAKILKSCTIECGKIKGDFVYSYNYLTKDLYLLPTDSKEYNQFNTDIAREKYEI